MKPVDFLGSNKVLGRPLSMTDEQCAPLHVYCDGQTCLSQWELTDEEIAWIVKTRRVNLWVWSGHTQPPVSLAVVSAAE